MPSFPCIPMNQSFLPYCTLQTNFCTTFTRSYFSILIIFDFFSQRVFLCALHLPSSWVRDQVGAGKDSVSCSKTLEQTGWSLLWAWSPATLPCNPEHWQLIWISKCLCCMEYFYPALLFLDFLKRQHVINGFHVCIGNYNISGNLEATCNWWGEKDGHLKYSQVQKKKKGNYIRGLELAHNKSSTKLSKVNNFAFMSLVCVFFWLWNQMRVMEIEEGLNVPVSDQIPVGVLDWQHWQWVCTVLSNTLCITYVTLQTHCPH